MICVPCKKMYRPEKNGVYVQEMMPGSNSMQPDPKTGWSPYKLWVGDKWKCPGCGHEVIGGIPLKPTAEHYQPDYNIILQRMQAMVDVINVADCGNIHGGQANMENTKAVNLSHLKSRIETLRERFEEIQNLAANSSMLLEEIEP